ncbi:MAG: prepilin-type N-terminal cleavage/methylation domain-containing protein [Alphaproteobacteria bacterium]|nr:prepilin-type N-terminal cleavage/methylation domain-containing protein [Alphaproteobacteria bacterium]
MRSIIPKINNRGFSLIEVTVALFLVGFLMVMVFKAQPFMDSARLKVALKMVDGFRVGTLVFMDKYGSLPGDYPKAHEAIASYLQSGNGNGYLEGDGMDRHSEAFWFWQHLGAAGIIPHPGKVQDHHAVSFGHGLPQTKLDGGFTVVQDPYPLMRGIWFVLGRIHDQRGTGAILTPLQTQELLDLAGERDMEEGLIRVVDGTDVPQGSCILNGQLVLGNRYPACTIYFKF